jgi:rare lipoprotein A
MNGLTVAHRTLPFGTSVKVTNCNNGKSVVVRVNDRGPSHRLKRRVIDLSQEAAKRLDMIKVGLVPVALEIVPIQPPVRNSHKQ